MGRLKAQAVRYPTKEPDFDYVPPWKHTAPRVPITDLPSAAEAAVRLGANGTCEELACAYVLALRLLAEEAQLTGRSFYWVEHHPISKTFAAALMQRAGAECLETRNQAQTECLHLAGLTGDTYGLPRRPESWPSSQQDEADNRQTDGTN